MSSQKESNPKNSKHKYNLVLPVFLCLLFGLLIGFLPSSNRDLRLPGKYLLANFDFTSDVMPQGVNTTATQYQEDNHYHLRFDEIGSKLSLEGFTSKLSVLVEISISGLTLIDAIPLSDVPIFTVKTMNTHREISSDFICEVELEHPSSLTFVKNFINGVEVVFTNYASSSNTPHLAYSIILSRVAIYELVA